MYYKPIVIPCLPKLSVKQGCLTPGMPCSVLSRANPRRMQDLEITTGRPSLEEVPEWEVLPRRRQANVMPSSSSAGPPIREARPYK